MSIRLARLSAIFSKLRGRFRLETLLVFGWWLVLAAVLALLLFDGFMFYRYGWPIFSSSGQSFNLDAPGTLGKEVRMSRELISARKKAFEADLKSSFILPNPFR